MLIRGMIEHHISGPFTREADICEPVADMYRAGFPLSALGETVRDLMLAGFAMLFMLAPASAQEFTVTDRQQFTVTERTKTVTKSTRREHYLVSEPWCGLCPAAKARFKSLGWPDENILTMAECERRFGFRVPYVPFTFGDPNHPDSKTKVKTKTVVRAESTQGRYYHYGGRTYDLETYGRCSMRSCGMCAEIMSARQRYFAGKQLINAVGPQAPSPDDVIDEALDLLQLTPDSVLCDLGCGDGRVLIAAVQRFGCRAIGVEIDAAKIAEARRRVLDSGLSDSVTLIQGDVREFTPARHSVSHLYAYLYPELLAEISGQLASVSVAVCPGHECPGIGMELVGQCWVRRKT